jgi:uncharacterized protein (TIGR03435 family)
MTLKDLGEKKVIETRLILFTYGVEDYQISGDPPWIGSDRYDIRAKAGGQRICETDGESEASDAS